MATYYEQSLSGNIKSLTVCGLGINFLGGPRPQARTRPQATSAQGTSNKLTSHKQHVVGGSRPQARAPRSLHKVLCQKAQGPLAGILP